MLIEAVGKQVALSVDKTGSRNTVIAMRTPNAGLVKPGLVKLTATAIVMTLWTRVAVAFFGVILMLLGAAFGGITGFVIALLITLFFASRPLLWIWRTFHARSALDHTALPQMAASGAG